MQPIALVLAVIAVAMFLHSRGRSEWGLALLTAAFIAQFLFTMEPWTLG